MNMTREELLATEKLPKLMLQMGIPTFIAQLVNLLYNIVDRVYIGHIPGAGALPLTGVGLCFPILTMIASFTNFVGAGGAPLAAIALGRNQRERAHKILANGATMLLFFSLSLTLIFYMAKKPILYLFGASDQTYLYANQYLSIYLLGTVFVMISLGLNTFITAQGQSKIAMFSILIGAIMNLILDPIFIFGFSMGVKGAALATIISQAGSAIWVLRFLFSDKATLPLKLALMKPDFSIIGSVSALGISPFIMGITESFITIVFDSGMQRYGNDLYVGSITIFQSLSMMVFTPLQGFAVGVQPIISYNFGAENKARVRRACFSLIAITSAFSLVFTSVAMCFPRKLAGIFTADAALLDICQTNLPIFIAGLLLFGLQIGCQQSFMALGQAKFSLCFALLRKVILLIPLALILPAVTNSVLGIYIAEPISDSISAAICGLTFFLSLGTILNKSKAAR